VTVWSHEVGVENGPVIALIHGAMDRSAGMLKLSRKLDLTYRVLRYDRRGYGRSKPHPGPFTMEYQVADLVELLAGRPAVLFGHSFGGNVALAAAERYPDLVRAVAVYEVPLSWLEWWPGSSSGGRTMAATRGRAEDAAERFIRRMVGDGRWESLPERTQDERRAEGRAFVEELTDLGMNEPWHSHGIGVPVVAVYGEHGREHHRDGCHYIAELLSDRGPIEIAGATHNGPFTHPDDVARVIRDLESRAPR
jgi:pimeloyl-ACP methyl ester carboxylesterase